ncbi:MAG: response regulator transcription factor [Gammaproteobacteria bacterium]|nr:response regulator transcription factor [Gammaproteobacteria bacterium]MDE2345464.1 response regulator transcription factor [Gammaproteobacteria bacterium]
MRLLIIEDDMETAADLMKGLQESGHVSEHAATGTNGLQRAKTGAYDALIVDRMLPGLDGLSLVRQLRADGINTPVLFLTALADVDDRVMGLQSGGDDYLAKPFAFAELLARVHAIARRGTQAADMILKIADLEMDRLKRNVTRASQPIALQAREFRLLEFLMLHAGQIVTRNMLLEQVWGYHFDPQTNLIDVHMSRLRSKIDKQSSHHLIHTVRGAGYCLREPERDPD